MPTAAGVDTWTRGARRRASRGVEDDTWRTLSSACACAQAGQRMLDEVAEAEGGASAGGPVGKLARATTPGPCPRSATLPLL